MKINLRDNLKLFSIAMIAIGSWLIKEKIQPKNPITTETVRAEENRFYSKSTKIINTEVPECISLPWMLIMSNKNPIR